MIPLVTVEAEKNKVHSSTSDLLFQAPQSASMEGFSFPSPRCSKPNSNALSSPMSHIYTSSDYFCSAPTSPSTAPASSSETNSGTDEFEFNTSSHYSKRQPHVMASADELFHDNQLLPLKLPPRLQCPSPPPPPPKPRGSIWKLRLLSALGFKRKEFDPFMAAMKRIRKEGMPRYRKPYHSRTRSHEPIATAFDRRFDCQVTGEAAGSKRDSHEGSKKPRKDHIIPFHGAPKGKGGVKDKVSDRSAGVREMKDGLEQNGDNCNARMVDIKAMSYRSLTRYKRSRTKFLSCFRFGKPNAKNINY